LSKHSSICNQNTLVLLVYCSRVHRYIRVMHWIC